MRWSIVLSAFLACWVGAASSAVAEGARLVMVEQRGCYYCALWNDQIAPIYPKTAEGRAAALKRMDIRDQNSGAISFSRPVVFTPTFVLVLDGKESGRIEGYPGEDFFWGLLSAMLTENGVTLEEPS